MTDILMESYSEVYKTIETELTQDIAEVRDSFLKHFGDEVKKFTERMSHAFLNWRTLDAQVEQDVKKAHVSALVYSAVTLHILSLKLFLSGHLVAAGNLQRQVLESIALAFLCSSKSLDVLDRYIEEKYSANRAVNDVLRHAENLRVNQEALEVVKQARDFYHKYSHPTLLTIASHISLSEHGMYVGASFDEEKLGEYEKEVAGRLSLAQVFSNFVDGIKANISKW